MFTNKKRLVILDADGTTIDAFSAITSTFSQHGMDLGDEDNFKKRHNFFKYMGVIKAFPRNLKKQLSQRKQLIETLTDVYRAEGQLYAGIAPMMQRLIDAPDVIVGIVTRNITNEPLVTLSELFLRHGVDVAKLDFMRHIPVKETKLASFKSLRHEFNCNPALTYVCGDEHKDYDAAMKAGVVPMMVSYGFENHGRLTQKYAIPDEIICRTPAEFCARLLHTLDIEVA